MRREGDVVGGDGGDGGDRNGRRITGSNELRRYTLARLALIGVNASLFSPPPIRLSTNNEYSLFS